ncbi:MAG: glycosyltransferase family 39 protein [Anaerolineae bacterium]|nr:glycosyltransferase family 39 protein [Anaerolineae bacterium]
MPLLRPYGLVVTIILVGFGLRIHNLQATPLRGDEAFSVLYWADTPLNVSLSDIAHGEPHTPLVYAIGRLWNHLIGGIDSVFALRYLSALGNILGAPAMIALAWRLCGRLDLALLAGLMWAAHPFEIWHSQEFRNYAYWGGISAVALWLGLRLIDKARQADWYLYAAVAGFAVLTIYTEWFSTVALAAFAILHRWRDWRFLRRLFVIQLGMAAMLIAGLLLIQVRQGFMSSYPGLVQSFDVADYILRFVPYLASGSTIPLDLTGVGFGLSLALVFAAYLVYRQSRRAFSFAVLTAAVPLLLLGLVSQRYNLFHPRYVLSATPGFILLLAIGSSQVAQALARRIRLARGLLTLAVALPWFALALLTLDAYFNNPVFRKAPAWDELGGFLNSRVEDGDLVIQLAVDPAFGYYYNGAARDIGLPVKADQPAAEISAALSRLSSEYDSIYVVAREQAGWANTGVVVEWMRANMQEVLHTDASGLPIRQYQHWSVSDATLGELASFDEIVALLGYDSCNDLLPSGMQLLRVYWRPLAQSPQPLKSFVHVYGPEAGASGRELRTQDDQYPQEGRLDSTTWAHTGVFREVYYLPVSSLDEGRYEILIGWYEPDSGERLLLADGTDSFALCAFEIAA